MTTFFNRITKTSCALGFAVFASLSFLSTASVASTPDGETPANEGVCDGLHGGTPGLYGLCVAYCEAQDLDTIDKNPPSEKILANYRKKMKDGDPDMPCVQAPCPCWSAEEIGAITVDGTAATCLRSGETTQLVDDSLRLRYVRSDQTARCAFVDVNPTLDGMPPIIRNQNVTAEEAASCYAQVEQACADVGL